MRYYSRTLLVVGVAVRQDALALRSPAVASRVARTWALALRPGVEREVGIQQAEPVEGRLTRA